MSEPGSGGAPTPRLAPRTLLLVLAAAVGLAAAAAAWYLLAVFVPHQREEVLSVWRGRLSAMADDRKASIERWIDDGLGDAMVVASFAVVRHAVSGDLATERAHLEGVLHTFDEMHRFRVLLADRTGAVVSRSSPVEGLGETYSETVRAALEQGAPFADLLPDRGSSPVVVFAAPVLAPDGGRIGAVVLQEEAGKWLFPFLRSEPVPSRTAETVLVRREGGDALFLSELRHSPAPPLSLRRPVSGPAFDAAASLKSPAAFGEFVDYRGTAVFAATRRLGKAPWGLVVKADREEVLADFHRTLRMAAIQLGLVVFALAGIVFGVYRRQKAAYDTSLARSEARLGLVLEHANDPIFFVDRKLRILDANLRAEPVYGYARGELLGKHVSFLRVGEPAREAAEELDAAFDAGSVVFETLHRRRDGSVFPVEVSSRRAELDGEPVLVSIVRDITERKAAESRILSLNRLLKTISEINQLIVREKDRDRLLQETCRITVEHGEFRMAWIGFADPVSHEVKPAAVAGLEEGYLERAGIHWDDGPRGRGPTGTSIRESRTVTIDDWRTDPRGEPWRAEALARGYRSSAALPIRKDGAAIGALSVYAAEPAVFSGEILGVLEGLAADIEFALQTIENERLRKVSEEALQVSEERLAHAQRMEAVGRLAGGVAHDFNNILTVINGYSDLALAGLAAEHPLRSSMEEIRSAGERAAALTRQLLAFSRKQVLQPVVLDLNGAVARSEKILRRVIGEDVELVLRTEPTLGRVLADPGQVEQILMNLAVNSRDAMPEGGTITIETKNVDLDEAFARNHPGVPPGGYVLVAFRDTGSGMDEEVISHLFEPFFTTKEKGKGTGLGLSTVYGIVRQSGGSVDVESAPGRGTCIRIYLPRVVEPLAPEAPSPAVSAGSRGDETILVVEDDDTVRGFTRQVLEARGYRVLTAAGGEEAAALSKAHPGVIHLLLTDVVMPRMSGRELAGRILAGRPGIRVLYVSGYTEDAIVTRGVLDEGLAFLPKPFTPEVLARKLREVLDGALPA